MSSLGAGSPNSTAWLCGHAGGPLGPIDSSAAWTSCKRCSNEGQAAIRAVAMLENAAGPTAAAHHQMGWLLRACPNLLLSREPMSRISAAQGCCNRFRLIGFDGTYDRRGPVRVGGRLLTCNLMLRLSAPHATNANPRGLAARQSACSIGPGGGVLSTTLVCNPRTRTGSGSAGL